jgi:anaerobic magnesium-protoporphyrin IX monomethyl ester cyclase
MENKTNILLVNPPYDIKKYMGGLGKIGWVFPPIGLLYIASYIREKNDSLNVKIYDSQVEKRNFFRLLENFKPSIVGITCQSALVYSALKVAEDIKKLYPNTKIIVGGVHPSIRPQDLIKSENIDLVIRGEGEETFLEVCNKIQSGKSLKNVLGITYLNDGKMVSTPDRPINKNLDVYPMPALDLIPINKYRISPDLRTGARLGLILTSRGCPYNCLFCANKLLTKRTYRLKSIEGVIEEIEYYIKEYNINQLMIIDDNFAVNRKRTMELCHEFIKRGYPKKFKWWAEARVDCLDEELLRTMKRAGCTILSFGLESGNQRLLDYIKKGITIPQIVKAVKLIKKVGIKSRASIILGLPTETRKESLRSIKFAYKLPLDQVRFSIATPFPGTELWDIAIKEGKIDPNNIDWTRLSLMGGYTSQGPLYYPEGRSPKEIKRLQTRANYFFYLKPRVILGFFNRIKSPSDFANLLKGFIHFTKSSIFKGRN